MKTVSTTAYLLLIALLPFSVLAHTGSLKGGVYDAQNQKPLEGANVSIHELKASTLTDEFGTYFFKDIPSGQYTVSTSYIGYETVVNEIHVKEGVTCSIITSMHTSQIKMSEVTINAKREANLSSLTGIDLKLRPVNTAQDMLKIVPGLFIAQHAGGGKAEQIFLRGFDIDHGTDINITVDGMPVNMVSHAHGQGYADVHFLIPELIDKVSFGKGPYKADKGNLATAGFVDFSTANFLDNSFVKMEAGNFGHFRTVAAIDLIGKNDVNNIKGAYIAGEYSNNRGYFEVPQNFNRLNLAGKFTSVLSKNRMVSLGLSAFRSNWDASGQIPERAVDEGIIGRFGELAKGEGGFTSRYNANVQFSQAIDERRHFKNNIFLSYYDFELYSNFTFFLNDSVNGDQIRQKEKRILTGYNGTYTSVYSIGKMRAKAEAGAGFRYDNSMDNELSRTRERKNTLSTMSLGDINETNVYAYAGNTVFLLPQLSLNTALRYDHFIHDYYNQLDTVYSRQSFSTGALTPKVNVYYNFSNSARIYSSYGIGFHSNDTRVVVAQKGQQVLPLSYSYDVGTVIKPFSKLLVSSAIWLMDMEDEFVYVGDEAIVENGGRTRRMGADFSARYEALRWLYLDGDITYTRARLRDAVDGENYVPLAANFTAIGGATLKFHNGISSGVRVRHIGDRPANEDYSVTAYGYTLFDATVNYSRPRYEFGLQMQNIFNVEWNEAQFDTETRLANERASVSEIHFTPGTPFFVKLSAAYKF